MTGSSAHPYLDQLPIHGFMWTLGIDGHLIQMMNWMAHDLLKFCQNYLVLHSSYHIYIAVLQAQYVTVAI